MYTVIFADDEEESEELRRIRDKLDERFASLKNGVLDGDFSERERSLELAFSRLSVVCGCAGMHISAG